jgi:hypothetical protein
MTTIQTSTFPQTSSLQRALATTAAIESDEVKTDKAPGAFETCFSRGLDLSEFTTVSDSNSNSNDVRRTTTSASSQLLRIKHQEKNKRRQEEREDHKMEQLLQKRLVTVRQSNRPVILPVCSPLPVMDALVQMHGGDETYKRTHSGKSVMKQKSLLRQVSGGLGKRQSIDRRNNNNNNKSSKQRVVTKKSRRNKY